MNDDSRVSPATGIGYALAAYFTWGLFPLYWKQLQGIPAFELILHRIVWSAFLMVPLVAARGQFRDVVTTLQTPRERWTLVATAWLVSSNWLAYVWAVNAGHILQGSLGYFLSPLVAIILGALVLKEKLRRLQIVAVVLAAVGVTVLTIRLGQMPWISLFLALTFSVYGLLRKMTRTDALVGLTVETLLLAPIAIVWLGVYQWQGTAAFLHQGHMRDLLLAAAGPATALPLLWYAKAARSLKFSTVGFIQYVSPTGQFLLAVLVYREDFSVTQLTSFTFIWVGLALYSIDTLRPKE